MNKPLRPCRHPGCRALTRQSYCDRHMAEHQRSRGQQEHRLSAARRGYGRKWRAESKEYLAEHPWCAECLKRDVHEPATEVDHIVPHKGNKRLFWDRKNWQGLCHRCHSVKTAKEDGGFGRPPGVKKF